MKQYLFFLLILVLGTQVNAKNSNNELALEYYIDSIIDFNDLDFELTKLEFLAYVKKNYKGLHNVKEFVDYSANKMKAKEKEYTKNYTKEFNELHAFAIMSKKNLTTLEREVYRLILTSDSDSDHGLLITLYSRLHEMNYWELNSYKPNGLGYKLSKLYQTTDNFDLVEKVCLIILSVKIYKANYYVNPMHICETFYVKTEIKNDLDSLNLNTKNITIDSIPYGIKPPTFVGGNLVMKSYIQDNLMYPEKALSLNHSGKVLTSFKVNEIGQIYNIRIKDSPSEYLSKEAIRIIESLPQFKPHADTPKGAGFTKFTMPLIFTLPEQ